MRNYTISISENHYDDKNAIDWGKVKYNRIDDLSINNISTLIKEGHCFCGIYGNDTIFDTFTVTQKTEANWRCSYFVAFDLDNIKDNVSITDFLDGLPYKPTISYTTPNNNIQKPNETKSYTRIRLLYFFDKPIISKSEYQQIYDVLRATFNNAYFDIEKTEVKCGRSPYQQYSGNAKKDCKMIVNECVYNKEEILEYKPISKPIQDTEKPIKKDDLKIRIEDDFLQNLNTLKPTDFLAYYRDTFQIIYETELDYNEEGYALLPNDYVRIQRNYTIYKDDGKIQSKYHRLKDGERRRNTLFCNAKIRCQIKQNISIEELIYNLVYDRHYFFDNSDKVLSNQCLLRIALDAKKATYQMKMKKKPLFKVDKVFCMENQIKPKAQANYVRRKLHFDDITKWYDTKKCVKDNLSFAKENNIKVSQKTLYNYCCEKGISTKGEKIEEPKNKAEISVVSSVKKVDETMCHTQKENALNRKIRHIQYVGNDELTNYINSTKNTMFFSAYLTKIMSLKMVI